VRSHADEISDTLAIAMVARMMAGALNKNARTFHTIEI
jgi:hypothetical protein